MYSVPKEINSEIKITKLFSLTDIIFMGVFGMTTLAFNHYVHSQYRTFYFLYCLLLGLLLSLPVRTSANKRRWESYLFWLFSDQHYYHRMTKTEGSGDIDEQKSNRTKEKKKRAAKKKHTVKTVGDKIQLIGREGSYYVTKEGDLMDILKINGVSGVNRFTHEDREHLIYQYATGLRILTQSLNFVILDFLVNYQTQIDFYSSKLNQLNENHDPVGAKHYWLAKEIDQLKQRQRYATEEQYFVFIFGENDQQLRDHQNQIKRISTLKIGPLEQVEKDALLYQLHNLNSLPLNKLRGSDGHV